jgi:signal transduction histidine kinase
MDSTSDSARCRREFLSRFFHDMATPLSAVSLHLEGADRRARRGADPTESLAIARAELSKAFELFEHGRDFLLKTPGPPETFSFDDLVAASVASDGGGAPAVEGTTGGRVRADRRALAEAVTALVSNAVESSGASAVSVFRERSGDRLRVRIENPGQLPAEDPESLFSPRAAAPGKTWGMGLARARLHAADAGGTVTLSQGSDRVTAILEIPEEPS